MATLNNHLILFDGECPMCALYTLAIQKAGVLDTNGRAQYQSLEPAACPLFDRRRAVNEIALVNLETGEVTYGIHSFFKLINASTPVFKPLFNFRPFVWFMEKVYAFVSYNRRVIVPAPLHKESFDIQPDFKLHYRIAWLFFTWVITAYILTQYAALLHGVVPEGGPWREYLICGGQIVFQGAVMLLKDRQKLWAYLGNMMTISFAGALLLLPVLLLQNVIGPQPLIYTAYFMLVAGAMLLEHIRRSKLLQLGYTLTITWALYRLAILLIIL